MNKNFVAYSVITLGAVGVLYSFFGPGGSTIGNYALAFGLVTIAIGGGMRKRKQ